MRLIFEGDEARSPNAFHLLLQKAEVHELRLENSRLASLLCKLQAVGHWKQLVEQGKLHRQLLQAQQVGTEEAARLLQKRLQGSSKFNCFFFHYIFSYQTEGNQLSHRGPPSEDDVGGGSGSP